MIERTTDRPAYLDHYDLNTAPFLNQIDDQFFYAGSTLMQRLDLLSHLTQFGDAVIVVTGPEGSGKTTLLQHLNKTAKTDWTICNLAASQAEQLQHLLAAHLGGYPDAPSKLLITEWINRSNDNDLLVVMVDDAHLLTQEGIQKLSVLFEDNIIDRTRLILFGTPELTDKVHHALDTDVFKNTAQVLEMPRFSADETSAYLLHRMAVAGYSGENPFTETEIQAIAKAADGRPSEINRQAELCLIEGHGRSNLKAITHRDKQTKIPFIAALIAGVTVLAGMFGWLYIDEPDPKETIQIASETSQLKIPPATSPIKKNENKGIIDRKAWSSDKDQPEPSISTEVLVEPEQKTTVIQPAESIAKSGQSKLIESTLDLPKVASSEDAAEATADVKPESVIQPIEKEEIVIAKPEPEPEPEPEQPKKKAEIKQQPEAELVPAPNQVAKKPLFQVSDDLSHREAWIAKQKPDSYTLQLLGARNEKAVRKFIKNHKLSSDKTAYYRGQYKGKDWYVVVYGAFKDKQTASKYIKNLPKAIRKATPWPRKMKLVQESISPIQTNN